VERRDRLRDELEGTLAAREELGRELEPQLVESFLDRIEQRLEERTRTPAHVSGDKRPELALAIVSLGVSIPLIAIAGGTAGVPGVAMVCVAIVLVNYLFRR
jgi:Flp pilus assembly protein TadB